MSGKNEKLKLKKDEKPNPAENCDHDTKLMVDLLAGEISEQDKTALSDRLTACEECRKALAALSKTWQITTETLKSEAVVPAATPELVAAGPADSSTVPEEKAKSSKKTANDARKRRRKPKKKKESDKDAGEKKTFRPPPAPFPRKTRPGNLPYHAGEWAASITLAVFVFLFLLGKSVVVYSPPGEGVDTCANTVKTRLILHESPKVVMACKALPASVALPPSEEGAEMDFGGDEASAGRELPVKEGVADKNFREKKLEENNASLGEGYTAGLRLPRSFTSTKREMKNKERPQPAPSVAAPTSTVARDRKSRPAPEAREKYRISAREAPRDDMTFGVDGSQELSNDNAELADDGATDEAEGEDFLSDDSKDTDEFTTSEDFFTPPDDSMDFEVVDMPESDAAGALPQPAKSADDHDAYGNALFVDGHVKGYAGANAETPPPQSQPIASKPRRSNLEKMAAAAKKTLAILGAPLLPALAMSRESARKISCTNNLKQIGLALRMYSNVYDEHFPPGNDAKGLDMLRSTGFLENPRVFVCPCRKDVKPAKSGEPLTDQTTSYLYIGGLTEADNPETPIACDKPNNHDKYGNILFVDGHVRGYAGADWMDKFNETRKKWRATATVRRITTPAATKELMGKTIIKHFECEDAPLSAVLTKIKKLAKRQGATLDFDYKPPLGDGKEPTLTIMFDDLPLDDAVRNLAMATDTRYKVGTRKVTFLHPVPNRIVRSNIKVSKKLFDFMGGSLEEVRSYLGARGASNLELTYDSQTGTLSVAARERDMARVKSIIKVVKTAILKGVNLADGLPFLVTSVKPFSTFSIDVDTASYTRCLKAAKAGRRPTSGDVRPEEFINYFDYHYREPRDGSMFSVTLDAVPNPFRPENTELRIGVQGKRLGADLKHSSMFTILIDSSGSMANENRLSLVKASIPLMLEKMRPTDHVSILECGSTTRVLASRLPVAAKGKIIAAVNRIQPKGITDLETGIVTAYKIAEGSYMAGAFNRVVVFTDGVSNISTASAEEVLSEVDGARKKGITNTIISVGGDGDDVFLEKLADKGDGNYVFIENGNDAVELFDKQFAARFREIARDVKIQVEFNPAYVAYYRQIGYKNRQLSKADFRNDTVDAGEVGSGQSVTALYEMKLQRGPIIMARNIYPPPPIATVRVRYKRADTLEVEEFAYPLTPGMLKTRAEDAPENMKLACAAAEFAESLEYPDVPRIANPAKILEFVRPLLSGTYARDAKVRELAEFIKMSK